MTRDELLSGNGELRTAALEKLTPHRLGWPGDRGYYDWEPWGRALFTLPPFDNWRYDPLYSSLSPRYERPRGVVVQSPSARSPLPDTSYT